MTLGGFSEKYSEAHEIFISFISGKADSQTYQHEVRSFIFECVVAPIILIEKYSKQSKQILGFPSRRTYQNKRNSTGFFCFTFLQITSGISANMNFRTLNNL